MGTSSLDPYGESVPRRCPRNGYDLVAREDPTKRFPATCRAWRCVYCGPLKAREKAAVVTWARPERFVTLTQAPRDWPSCRQKVRRLAYELRRAGHRTEWAWTVEEGRKTGMRHVHLLQHGHYIAQAELQERWGAIVDIRRIGSREGAAAYVLKEAARVTGYALKGTGDLGRHLDLNGNRGVHLSRLYLKGLTSAQVVSLLRAGNPDFTWVLVPAGQVLPHHLVIPQASTCN